MSQTAEILTVMDMVTSNAARALRVPDFGVAVGVVADLVVLDVRDAREAFATRSPRCFVIRSGKLIAESMLETRRYFDIPAMPAR
jgi:cytosine/creatinine deaminase